MEETFYQNKDVNKGQRQTQNLEKGTQCKERGEREEKGHFKTVIVRQALRPTVADKRHTQPGRCSSQGHELQGSFELPVSPEGSSFSRPPLHLAL